MPHSGSCLCGQTKIEVGGDSFTEQVCRIFLLEVPIRKVLRVIGANHDVVDEIRSYATVRIVGRRVEVLSVPTSLRLRRM